MPVVGRGYSPTLVRELLRSQAPALAPTRQWDAQVSSGSNSAREVIAAFHNRQLRATSEAESRLALLGSDATPSEEQPPRSDYCPGIQRGWLGQGTATTTPSRTNAPK